MEGIQNFLNIIYDNWTTILVCLGLIVGIVRKTITYASKTKEEKVAIVKQQIQQTILKMISDAEFEWEEWDKAGSIKRSQVIKQIYDSYPILNLITDQQSFIAWVDEQIDNALGELKNVIQTQE